MNQGKLEVVKQEMARVNIHILGISELKWTGIGKFNSDNHDGVIIHVESDILECKVKWALGSITMNKVSGGDVIPAELFQTLKDDAVKVLHTIC